MVSVPPSYPPYLALLAAVAAERLLELRVARDNARWSLAHGGEEHGRGHYPAMVALHTLLLLGCVVEPLALHRPFLPAFGFSMAALVGVAQLLRWWCIFTLGRLWNTRVIVIRGMRLVRRGPYRLLDHPNYLAVIIEGLALPLVHSAWLTATCFSLFNAALLSVRVRCENAALAGASGDDRRTARAASCRSR